MSTTEKRAWTEVILWSLALAFVWMRFTTGWEFAGQSFGLQVVEQSPGQVFATYLGTGLIVAALQLGLRAAFRSRGEDLEQRDEREQLIELRSNQIGYWTGVGAINVIIVHVIATRAFAFDRDMPLDLTSMTGIVFALLAALILQEVVRNGATLLLHRIS
jgi:hypothetical protein